MAKKRRTQIRASATPLIGHTTARRFDGGAVKLEIVFQPQDAAQLTDQLVNALIRVEKKPQD